MPPSSPVLPPSPTSLPPAVVVITTTTTTITCAIVAVYEFTARANFAQTPPLPLFVFTATSKPNSVKGSHCSLAAMFRRHSQVHRDYVRVHLFVYPCVCPTLFMNLCMCVFLSPCVCSHFLTNPSFAANQSGRWIDLSFSFFLYSFRFATPHFFTQRVCIFRAYIPKAFFSIRASYRVCCRVISPNLCSAPCLSK